MQPEARYRDPATLLDIRIAGQKIHSFINGLTEAGFQKDALTQAAVKYELTLIGEAVARLSPGFLSVHPSLPWVKIKALRNRLVHAYDAIDLNELWAILQVSLPPLLAYIDPLIPPPDSE